MGGTRYARGRVMPDKINVTFTIYIINLLIRRYVAKNKLFSRYPPLTRRGGEYRSTCMCVVREGEGDEIHLARWMLVVCENRREHRQIKLK